MVLKVFFLQSKKGTVPLWGQCFRADVLVPKILAPIQFGADTFWRRDVLASVLCTPKVLAPKRCYKIFGSRG